MREYPKILNQLLGLRYTHETVRKTVSILLLVLATSALSHAEETSFRKVMVSNRKGKLVNAVLTFSDNDKALEVRPKKGDAVTIPYSQIDKASYEYKSQISVGLSKSHWLQIDYHDQSMPKVFILHMDKHEYIHILDALKAHTGIDAEVLGNANKRLK